MKERLEHIASDEGYDEKAIEISKEIYKVNENLNENETINYLKRYWDGEKVNEERLRKDLAKAFKEKELEKEAGKIAIKKVAYLPVKAIEFLYAAPTFARKIEEENEFDREYNKVMSTIYGIVIGVFLNTVIPIGTLNSITNSEYKYLTLIPLILNLTTNTASGIYETYRWLKNIELEKLKKGNLENNLDE